MQWAGSRRPICLFEGETWKEFEDHMGLGLLKQIICSMSLLVAALPAAPAALAQPFVPVESYNRTRPDFGNRLPLCVIPNSPTLGRDREVAAELAHVLLLEPEIDEMDVDVDLLDSEGLWPSILLHLAEKCVGIMGVQIIPGEIAPDWMILSRPYFEAPYVLLTRDDEIENLADLPAETRVGVPLYTPIDIEMMTVIAAGGQLGELRRLPYDRPELMASLMRSREMDAAIVWEPHLELPTVQPLDFFVGRASIAPLRQDRRAVAVLLRSQDQMLRTMIDDAIAALSMEIGP